MAAPETTALIEAVDSRQATASGFAGAECRALSRKVADAVKESFDLLLLCDEMEQAEPDADLRASLGEYRQKFGALDRELRKLREQIQHVETIKAELHSVHLRLAAKVRENDR